MMAVRESGHRGDKLRLLRPSPNPFTASTHIVYSVPVGDSQAAKLVVHDVSGRVIRSLVNAVQAPGQHRTLWDGTDDAGKSVGAGAYFYRLTVGAETATRRMLMVR